MPNDARNLPANREAQPPAPRRTIEEATDRMIGFIEKKKNAVSTLLGGEKEYDKFKQVVVMALHKTPDMLDCDPKSFVDSCLTCASDGLVPDGRRAALVYFKDRDGRKIVNYIPMIRGVIECIYRTGLVRSHQVDVVYEGEPFVYRKGLNGTLEHEPVESLRGDDSKIVWAYALIETIAGGVFYTAMTRKEIDKIKSIAKTDKVWRPFFAEMSKKTVIRNLSKSLPFDLEVARRDDVLYDLDRANAPAIPAQRPVALTANPADRIEDDPEAPETRQEADKDNPPAPQPKEPDNGPDGVPEPPAEASGSKVQDADVEEPAKLSEAAQKLRQWVMDQITKVKTGDDLEKAMGLAWEHAAWPELEAAGKHTPIYQIIVVTEAFDWLDVAGTTYQRIKDGK